MYKMLGIEKERRHRYFVTIATTSGDKAGKSSTSSILHGSHE